MQRVFFFLLTISIFPLTTQWCTAEDGVAQWIDQLSNEKLSVRIEAQNKLWKAGSSIQKELEDAALAKNPETSLRVAAIIRKIKLGITPDSPKEIVALVESFANLSIEDKKNAIEKLKESRQWRIALLLFQNENDGTAKAQMRENVDGIAIVAARESLLAGDSATARKFLDDFSEDPKNLMAKAWMARSSGTLDQEIADCSKLNDKKSIAYHLCLLRVKGDRAAAIDLAEKNNLVQTGASLQLLDGQSDMWLDLRAPSFDNDSRELLEIYIALVKDRTNSSKEHQSNVNRLIKEALKGDDYQRRWLATHLLFALGLSEPGEKSLKALNPVMLFDQYVEQERIDEAIQVLGLDPANPDYEKWLSKRMSILIEKPDLVENEMEQIPSVLSFLEKRGLTEVIDKVFVPQMLALAEKDAESFIQMLQQCFSPYARVRIAPETALKVAIAYAKDDDVLWGTMIESALPDNNQFNQWWDWIAELYPAATRAERFTYFITLFRIIPDRQNQMADIDHKIEKFLKACDATKIKNYLKLVSIIAEITGNTKYAQWATAEGESMGIDDLIKLERWEDAEKELQKLFAKSPDSIDLLLRISICQRLLGKTEEAKKNETLYESLILGDATMMSLTAAINESFGQSKKASEWRQITLTCSSPSTPAWLINIYQEAEKQMLNGQWSQASSGYEAYLISVVNQDSENLSGSILFRTRKKADMAYAFGQLKKNPEVAVKQLKQIHQSLLSDASLADQFFPCLRLVGLRDQHNQWFEETWQSMMKLRDRFPLDDNIRNSAAWLAARSMQRLDDAEKESTEALRLRPNQAAYLDTMAEIYFARGNREKAIEWSKKSTMAEPGSTPLLEQYYRFLHDDFPR